MAAQRKILLSLLTLAFVFAFVSGNAFALSSQEALSKAQPYLDFTMAAFPKPLFTLSDYYYVYAPSIYSPQRIFVAVSDRSGEVEIEPTRLSTIGLGVYEYGVLQEYVRKNKISFSDMQTTTRQALIAVERNVDSLGALESRTQQSYASEPAANFDSLRAKADLLQSVALDLDSMVSDGVSLERDFDNDFSDLSLHGLVKYYQTVFAKANAFIAAYDDFNNAISQKQTAVFKSSIPAPDNENIVKNLENMRLKIDLFENLRFLKPWENLDKLAASREKWVNDSVSSFSYKKLQIDALAKYGRLKPLVQSIFSSEAVLTQCGLHDAVASFKSKWQEVELLRERSSASDLQRLPAKIDALGKEYDSIKKQYDACTGVSSSSTLPSETSGGGQTNYLPILVVLVIGAGAYLFWRYKQSQEETYS